jgi:hypothetical protein
MPKTLEFEKPNPSIHTFAERIEKEEEGEKE